MDPISQGALGAALAQSTSRRRTLAWIALFGCVGGLAPDLDVFIFSPTDPLLSLEYHRQFTHSLIFIPIGALIVSALLSALLKHPLTRRQAYLAALAGYATHGLLDACTSYGTQLLWPFSNARVSWNTVSVIDPAFTLPLLGLCLISIWRRNRLFSHLGLLWALAYLAFGSWQQARVTHEARALAAARAHAPQSLLVKPAFGNLLLWKSVYRHQGRYFVDGFRATRSVSHCAGDEIAALNVARDLPDLDPHSQQAKDLERFRWFSMGYLARYVRSDVESLGQSSALIIDVRYSNLPNRIAPMWGVEIAPDAGAEDHVGWWTSRRLDAEQRSEFNSLLAGSSCAARPTYAKAERSQHKRLEAR